MDEFVTQEDVRQLQTMETLSVNPPTKSDITRALCDLSATVGVLIGRIRRQNIDLSDVSRNLRLELCSEAGAEIMFARNSTFGDIFDILRKIGKGVEGVKLKKSNLHTIFQNYYDIFNTADESSELAKHARRMLKEASQALRLAPLEDRELSLEEGETLWQTNITKPQNHIDEIDRGNR